jgi:hypothetical protein
MCNKYFFLHVPKTAGSSLFRVFNDVLGEENIKQVESINRGVKQIEKLNEYQFIGGHFTYLDYLEFINKDRYTITFLRNPVDRFLSQYFFYKNNVSGIDLPAIINAKKLDLKSYIEYYRNIQRCGEVFNRQVWYFTGIQKATITENELVKIAKDNLSQMDFVGICEEIDDSIDLLCYDCKWPLVNNIPVVNVTDKKPDYAEIDSNTLEKIKELNDLDFQLYEHALKLFKDKKRKVLQEAVKVNHEMIYSSPDNIFKAQIDMNEEENLQEHDVTIIESKANSKGNYGTREINIVNARVCNNIDGSTIIESGGKAFIEIMFNSAIKADNVVIGFTIEDEYGQIIYGTNSLLLNQRICTEECGKYCIVYDLNMNIAEGKYKLNVTLHSDKCYSLSSEFESSFHKFLDIHLDECYHCCNKIADFRVAGIRGVGFEGVVKLKPSLSASKIQIMDKADRETMEKVSLKIKETPSKVAMRSVFYCTVDIINFTPKVINSIGDNPVNISYHWLNENGDVITHFGGERSNITPSLLPFNHSEYRLKVISPEEEGKYRLRVTLVQEGIAWLDELNPCLAEDVIIEVK